MLGIWNDIGLLGNERWINPFTFFLIQVPVWTLVDYIFPLTWKLILNPIWNLIVWWFTIPPEQKIMMYTYIVMGLVVTGIVLALIGAFFLVLNIIYSTIFEDTLVALLIEKTEEWVESGEEAWAVWLEFYYETREKYPKEDMSFGKITDGIIGFWKYHED